MKITKMFSIFLVAVLFISCTNTKKESVTVKETVVVKETTLFERLGGKEGISAIVDDIIAAHLNNPAIKDRFKTLSENPKRFELFKQTVKDFFGAGTGGDVTYKGRDMKSAHTGMQLSGMEFVEAISDIMKVLEEHNIDVESKKDVLYILYSFKDAVIGH